MSGFTLALVSFVGMLGLMVLRVPIAVSMLLAGGIGYVAISGATPLLAYLKTAAYYRFSTYELTVIPLFLLMGQFAAEAGLSRAMFSAANAWLGHRKGGVAMAAVGACAGFGAICGSSLATAATMCRVALPEMRRFGYSGGLAGATLAAGGTLGILIPPSVPLVVYGILTEQSIGKLFIAAFIPGIIATVSYMIVISIYVRVAPEAGPAGRRVPMAERLAATRDVWAILVIFLVVLGGIYIGWFTPTEGAAMGAFATGVIGYLQGGLDRRAFMHCLLATANASAIIFLILFGADIFNAFLALTRMPVEAARLVGESGLSPYSVVVAIVIIYLLLGCFMDSLSMILLTMPVFFPIIGGLDFGMSAEDTAIWFGIVTLMTVEIGLITPPIGLNVYIIGAMAQDVPMGRIFRSVCAFLVADACRISLLIAAPVMCLWLLRLLG